GIRDDLVTGVQTCALPISGRRLARVLRRVDRAPSRTLLEPVLELIASGAIDPTQVTSETATWDDAPAALLGYTTKLVVTREPVRSEERRVGEGGAVGRGGE